jgi:hypothetical protein
MGLVALIAFWCLAIRLWMIDGPKIPLIFIAIWLVALFAIPALGWPGFIFLSVEALLAAILLIVERYKSAL